MYKFPLCIPPKYWVVEDPFPICDLVASHRKYYQAKLQKGLVRKIKCKECNGTSYYDKIDEYSLTCDLCNGGFIKELIKPTFTRREKPAWLNLEGEK